MQSISRLLKSFIFETFQISQVSSTFLPEGQGDCCLCVSPQGVGGWGTKIFSIVQNLFLEQGWPHVAIMIILLNSLDFTVCGIQVTSLFSI